MEQRTKLGLGGHSFIQELGNDPEASFAEQCAIVAECLDTGIAWIDTTYYQERIALGKVLQDCQGQRNAFQITAWNFFQQPGQENALVGFTNYKPDSLAIQLAELQTDYLDLLVIHTTDDREALDTAMTLSTGWREAGLVREVGLGMARREDLDNLPKGHPFHYVLAPYNAFDTRAAELFAEAKAQGLTTVAMSPFVRGWTLDRFRRDSPALAALLLRWVTSQEIVDTVFISMRRPEWVRANRNAEVQGPLSEDEVAIIRDMVSHY